MIAESAYEQWRQPHHEGADWAAFEAGYEAGVRAAAEQINPLTSAYLRVMKLLKANFNNPPTY